NVLFDGALLGGAYFGGADLRGADLSQAWLGRAYFGGADLRGADLSHADLGYANLSDADLGDAHMSGARIRETVFGDNDLSTVRGLDKVNHQGASTIGIATLYKSRGKIPEVFLRGAGVPENFIAYFGALVSKPIEFYSCFISYSHADKSFARRL